MKRLAVLLHLLLLPALAAQELPLERGPELIPGGNDAGWQPLLAALAAPGDVFSRFVEQRWFPFREKPVVLSGEMRLSSAHGLSLHYLEPEEQMMIVDEHGILLRDARGRSRQIRGDARSAAASTALLPVLRFDLVALQKAFVIHAARRGERWRFDFAPRDATLARSLGSISAFGAGEQVARIEIRRSEKQRVVILLHDSRIGTSFTADERKRFFR